MKNNIVVTLVIFALFCVSCFSDNPENNIKTLKQLHTEETNLVAYSQFLDSLNLKNKTITERKERFFSFINTEIPAYWIGTKWDFNGTTRTPKKGNIACGYFVTNVLSDFGFEIKRIYLAQQASSVMIKQLSEPTTVKHLKSVASLTTYLNNQPDKSIFIIG